MKASADQKPVALVLGGTSPHVELVRNLQRRGYCTILIDYLEAPPAKSVADAHIRESTLDGDKVLAIAKRLSASLVISTCIDQANLTACYVAERMRLPAPYGYEVALNVTNKLKMKKMMLENNIPTSRYYRIRHVDDCRKNVLSFPLIVKPADSNSSKGVRRADDEKQLHAFIQLALQASRTGEALVEEFVEGIEVGIDAYIRQGKAAIVFSRERSRIPLEFSPLQQIYGSVWPSDLVVREYPRIKSIAENIAKTFSLDNTPLMIQAIVKNDGQVNVIEFAPRVGGGENYKIINLATSIDMVNAAVESFLGLIPSLDARTVDEYWFDNYLYASPGVMGKMVGCEPLLQSGVIEYFNTYKMLGTEVGQGLSSNNRIGVVTIKSQARNDLLGKIRTAVEAVDILDSNGQSIMRRDIYGGNSLAKAARFL